MYLYYSHWPMGDSKTGFTVCTVSVYMYYGRVCVIICAVVLIISIYYNYSDCLVSSQTQKDLFLFGETVKDYIALLASIRVSVRI